VPAAFEPKLQGGTSSMGAAYSQDLRDRIIAARVGGMRTKRVAELFQVSASWVRRVIQRRREHGEQGPRPRGGATVIKVDLDQLRQLVQQQPDATVRQLHARLCERLGITCSVSAVDMALRRMGLSFKKRRCTPPSRIGPMSRHDAVSGERINPGATFTA
jgi:transposase